MGILERLNKLFAIRGGKKESDDKKNSPRRGYTFESPLTAPLAIATVYRCVNVIADIIARLPVQCLRHKGEIFVDDTANPLHYLLNVEPCEWSSAFDMKRQAVAQILLHGNAYIVPVLSELTPTIERLVLVTPGTVTHDVNTDTYKVNDLQTGVCGVFEEDEILHLKNFSFDGKTGVSTVAFARRTLDIANRGDSETLKRFTTGGTVRGILSNSTGVVGVGEYQDEELDRLASEINDRFNGGENIVATHGQAKLDIISMTSADMQFLESRKFQVLDICRFFGVPPFFVYSDTSNNYKSTEMAELSFFSDTLAPLITKIENEFNRKLIGRYGYGKRKISLDVTQMHPMDNNSRMNYLKTILQSGATINEARTQMNLPPKEGCDEVILSANYKTIDMLRKEGGLPNNNDNETDSTKKPSSE